MDEMDLEEEFGEDFEIRNSGGGASSDIAQAVAKRSTRGIKEGTTIAMKSPKSQSANCIERFRREAKILQELHTPEPNPYVIGHHGIIETSDGIPIILMEWAPRNLSHVRRKYRHDFHESLMDSVIERTCYALSSLHHLKGKNGEGFVHRDVKPSNILFLEGDLPKLGDFGSAGINIDNPNLGRGCSSYGIHGTPNYAAPESLGTEIEKKEFGIQSDIYMLGLVAFYLFEGETPCEGGELEDNIVQMKKFKLSQGKYAGQMDKTLEAMFKKRNVPDNKAQAIWKALRPLASERWESIDEFLQAYSIGGRIDPLQGYFDEIQKLLAGNHLDGIVGTTDIMVVDTFLRQYEHMKSASDSPLVKQASDMIQQRADHDWRLLKQYVRWDKEEAGRGQAHKDLPTNKAEAKLFVRSLVQLFYTWGNEFGSFVKTKYANQPRAPPGDFDRIVNLPGHEYMK